MRFVSLFLPVLHAERLGKLGNLASKKLPPDVKNFLPGRSF